MADRKSTNSQELCGGGGEFYQGILFIDDFMFGAMALFNSIKLFYVHFYDLLLK